ncbi:TniQ family protein [Pseudobowmanella zhangzhouensis]
MRETLDIITPEPDKQFALRLNHTPFAPWLLSLPGSMAPHELKEASHRPNTEENPFQVDRRWKYCPNCMQIHKAKFGVSYWRATHQLPGALICEEHGTPLHSHDELRYLAFKLPHHYLHKSQALVLEANWQHDWQSFIYRMSRQLQSNPEWARNVAHCMKSYLGLERVIKHTHRVRFGGFFECMKEDLGQDCLAGLFTRFARGNGRQPNILWLTLSGYSQGKGLRHPLYWLACLFWLRSALPELAFLHEHRSDHGS